MPPKKMQRLEEDDSQISHKRSKQSRFPLNRIKRIMQTDEEVGKIALASPVLVSKALELFMQELVDASCTQMKPGSKRLLPLHVKKAIEQVPEKFDFLKSIVAHVQDNAQEASPSRGKGKKAAVTPTSATSIASPSKHAFASPVKMEPSEGQ